MNDNKFFDVKTRTIISIDRASTWKYSWKPTTRPNRVRYAVCGKTPDGRVLTKFTSKEFWNALDVPIIENSPQGKIRG